MNKQETHAVARKPRDAAVIFQDCGRPGNSVTDPPTLKTLPSIVVPNNWIGSVGGLA